MHIGPFSITRRRGDMTKAAVSPIAWPPDVLAAASGGGWWPVIRESFAGAWQRNISVRAPENVLTFNTVYACLKLIASDIGKLVPQLVTEDGEFTDPIENPAFSPVLRKPNHFQNRIQFFMQWTLSKLIHGNTYVLKERDNRNVVTELYVLDPSRVKVLVAPDGAVFYELRGDYLSGVSETITVPAREIIHDLNMPLYHPLCGVSPISACGMAAVQGLNIQEQSSHAFANQLNPGGVLSAPNHIPPDTAERLRKHWEENFTGPQNFGRVAVLGDGLKFDKMMLTAVDAQLIEQLKWTGEAVCSCFNVPSYMVGVGAPPNYNNIEALNQQYYSQCLQALIEAIELCLEEGLGLGPEFGNAMAVEFDLDGLLRMDSATKMKTATDGVKGGVLTPNEGRRMHNKRPLTGGDTVYLQQQDYSLEALNARDRAAPAPSSATPPTPTLLPAPPPAKTLSPAQVRMFTDLLARKAFAQLDEAA